MRYWYYYFCKQISLLLFFLPPPSSILFAKQIRGHAAKPEALVFTWLFVALTVPPASDRRLLPSQGGHCVCVCVVN